MDHPFEPVWDPGCRILILGTMPSPQSRETGMYYAHPRNHFWPILGGIMGRDPGNTPEERYAFLLESHIAVWDTLAACEIDGSDDGSIRRERPNDIPGLTAKMPLLQAVYLNGGAAARYYRRYHAPHVPLPWHPLPSTSPRNAGMSFEKKLEQWSVMKARLFTSTV